MNVENVNVEKWAFPVPVVKFADVGDVVVADDWAVDVFAASVKLIGAVVVTESESSFMDKITRGIATIAPKTTTIAEIL